MYSRSEIIRFVQLMFFCLVISSIIRAQGPSLDLGVKIQHMQSAEDITVTDFSSQFLIVIDQTTAERRTSEGTLTSSRSYEARIGAEMMAGINDRMRVRTGVGIGVINFDVASTTTIEILSITSDTVGIMDNGGDEVTPYCEVFTNSFTDVDRPRAGTSRYIASLKLPVEVIYEVVPDRMEAALGGYIQTPIVSNRRREYISTHREMINGRNECEYRLVTDNDNSGSDLRNLQSGVHGWLAYNIGKRMWLELGLSQDLNNTFYTRGDIFGRTDSMDFRPTKFWLGLRMDLPSRTPRNTEEF